MYDARTKEELEALAEEMRGAQNHYGAELQNAYPMTTAEMQQAAVNRFTDVQRVTSEIREGYYSSLVVYDFARHTLRTPACTLLAWLKGTP